MVAPEDVDALAHLLAGRKVVVLSGAGCSTESGIPDYRGPGTRERARNPIQAREFVSRPEARARYWRRSAVGYPKIAAARPNAAHRALARLEAQGTVRGIITQNVDGLHQVAGSRVVIELHGALSLVRCLGCDQRSSRDALQSRLLADNPHVDFAATALAPDGDADVEIHVEFRVPSCEACGGVLKPDVVFFGEGVPRPRVDAAFALLESADALLVVGSSLAVFSGYRFVRHAHARGVPVAIVNLGETRGDPHASLRVDASAGAALAALAARLDLAARSSLETRST
ncbi:MAG: NAD-dependent protein deacetylase [Polyangiaceae bacterium]